MDLTLPDWVPELEPANARNFGETVALYALADGHFVSSKLEDCRRRCASEVDDLDWVQTPPRAAAFHDLREIVDYHVLLAREGDFDPRYFIVTVSLNSDVVLIVTLDDNRNEQIPDRVWVKTEDSALNIINLQIANMSWAELKEAAEELNIGHEDFDGTTQPPPNRHIQLYLYEDIEDSWVYYLHPGTFAQQRDHNACRKHRLSGIGKTDLCKEAAKLHPGICSNDKSVEKEFFLVADDNDMDEKGLMIVRLDKQTSTSSTSRDDSQSAVFKATFETQRVRCYQPGERSAIRTLFALADGQLSWVPPTRIGVYGTGYGKAKEQLARSIDRTHGQRNSEAQRIAIGSFVPIEELVQGAILWPMLLHRHKSTCRHFRFHPTFVRGFFIWCEVRDAYPQSKAQLVKLDWDGDLDTFDQHLEHISQTLTAVTTTADQALALLDDMIEGKKPWSGEPCLRSGYYGR